MKISHSKWKGGQSRGGGGYLCPSCFSQCENKPNVVMNVWGNLNLATKDATRRRDQPTVARTCVLEIEIDTQHQLVIYL